MTRLRIPLYRGSRAALRNASLIRPCQPRPVERKCATTSGSRRRDISFFTGARCFPRIRRYAATICGTTSSAGRMRAKSSSVNSRASGSRAIPRRSSASSASLISASWRRAFFRAARQGGLSDRFDIFPHITLLSFSQTNDSGPGPPPCEGEYVESRTNEANRDFSQFAVVFTVVDEHIRRFPLETLRRGKVDSVISDVLRALVLVPGISARNRHRSNCSYKQAVIQDWRLSA
jgi:hypothetical protein